MKSLASFFFLILLAVAFSSCKKSNSDFQVEYKVSPDDSYLMQVSYTDSVGIVRLLTDPTQFLNGTRTVVTSKRPFNAVFDVKARNTTSATLNYTVGIYVNGQLKAWGTLSAPPMALMTEEQIYYTIN